MAETVDGKADLTDCPQSEVLEGPNSGQFTCKITDKKLINEIWNAKWNQFFESEPFTMANLTWKLFIYPNGQLRDAFGQKRTVEVCVSLQLLNSNQFISEYQISLIISDQDSFVLASNMSTHDYLFWNCNYPSLSVWKSISMGTLLTITVSVNIHSLLLSEKGEHLMNDLHSISAPLISVPKNVCFRWVVNPQVFSVFKNIGTGHQGYWRGATPIFANMWQIMWSAISQGDGDHNVFAELVCINPPPFAATIQVTVICEISGSSDSQRNNIVFKTQFGGDCYTKYQIYQGNHNLNDVDKITFIVDIESINVIYYDPKELNPFLICDPAQIAYVLSLNEARKSAQYKKFLAVSDDHKSVETESVAESVKANNKQIMDAIAAEIVVLQSTVKEQQEKLEENKNFMNDMMKRMELLEKALETQYKPRIKSLWNGLHGMDKVTKSIQNQMKQSNDESMMNEMNDRISGLEMNMNRIMMDKMYRNEHENSDLVAVRRWMKTVVKLPQYLDLFIENGFEDLSVIQTLTVNDLMEMGIEKKGHRIKIVQCIAKLQASGSGYQKPKTDEGAAWI